METEPNAYFLFALTFLGAFGLYVLHKNQNNDPFSFLKAINVDVGESSHPRTIIFDICLTSLLGSLLVFFISEPQSSSQAVMTGLGFSGVISAFTNGGEDEKEK
ncbi:MAG: hypothetical protein ACSHX8_13920 [Opitutaceae bacterium]